MKYFSFIFICICLSCFPSKKNHNSQITKKENGISVFREYNDRNILIHEAEMVDGMKNGISKIYYQSGRLSDLVIYENNLKNGIAKKFYPSGELYNRNNYIHGNKDGTQKRFYKSGKIWSEVDYKKGSPGKGLIEYKLNGKIRTNYPEIKVEQFTTHKSVKIKLQLSNYSKKVAFYITDLLNNKYIPYKAKALKTINGVARKQFYFNKNLDTIINIVAKYETQDRNIYICEKKYRIKIP